MGIFCGKQWVISWVISRGSKNWRKIRGWEEGGGWRKLENV